MVFCLHINAQTWVTIPDPHFVSYLQSIVPSAMSANQLNTTSTVVTTYNYQMTPSHSNIASLFGIQYFTSVTYLDCSNNALSNLPALPNSIQNLDCSFNSLTTLPALPTSLIYLECHDNQLTSLPTLPNSLTYLFCSNNMLTSIPPLSNTCKGVYCDLYCDYNQLTSLPALPDSLNQLVCNNNNITCFPTFPVSINRYSGPGYPAFSIDPNPYNCLPNHIPAMNATDLAKPLCTVGNSNGCAVAGITTFNLQYETFQIYPNPAQNNFFIETNNIDKQVLQITDVSGKQVLSQTINGTTSIDISNLSPGVYNLSLTSSQSVANKRLVIVK